MIDTNSEEYRREQEAKHVIQLGSKFKRQTYIDGVKQKRGIAGAIILKQDILKYWDKYKK